MKIQYQGTAPAPPPAQPSLFDEAASAATAHAVATAPTQAEAWDLLRLPGAHNADVARDLLALTVPLSETSDAIVQGLTHFAALGPDDEVPEEWVDRMVELHLQELEGYWALDERVVASQSEGGWVARQDGVDPLPANALERIVTRARWQVEALKPPTGKLAFDRVRHRLDEEAALAQGSYSSVFEEVKQEGRALVAWVARWRFAHWQTTRTVSR